MKKVFTKHVLISALGIMISPLLLADVNKYCQFLHDRGSLQREPDVCSNYVPFNEKSATLIPSEELAKSANPYRVSGGTFNAYIYEGRTTDNMSTHPIEDFSNQTILGTVPGDIFTLAFDETAKVLYAIENSGKNLITIDQSTGELTTVGPLTNAIAADTMTGLDIAPDGTCYVTSTDDTTNTLYTCDLATGTLTIVGSQTTTPLLIGIAADCNGTLYGHDVGDDNIYTIDSTSGAATLIGPTGLDANFAQDLTYDRNLHILYGYIYTGGGSNTYGSINTCTGAVTPLAVNNPEGEHYGATKTRCDLSDAIFRNGLDC